MPGCKSHFGAGASSFGTLPAEPLEDLVATQVQNALAAPPIVQAVWDTLRSQSPDLTEPEVVLPMRRLGTLWPSLFPAERYRLVQLLIERIQIGDAGLEIVWRDNGWHALAEELLSGTIAHELAELEDAA